MEDIFKHKNELHQPTKKTSKFQIVWRMETFTFLPFLVLKCRFTKMIFGEIFSFCQNFDFSLKIRFLVRFFAARPTILNSKIIDPNASLKSVTNWVGIDWFSTRYNHMQYPTCKFKIYKKKRLYLYEEYISVTKSLVKIKRRISHFSKCITS